MDLLKAQKYVSTSISTTLIPHSPEFSKFVQKKRVYDFFLLVQHLLSSHGFSWKPLVTLLQPLAVFISVSDFLP